MTSLALPTAQPSAARQALALLRTHPLEAAAGAVLAFGAAASIAAVNHPTESSVAAQTAPAVAEPAKVQEMTPFAVRQLAADEALKLNAAVPLAGGPNPPAAPFILKTDEKTYARALECLSQAIYYEAAREPEEGQRAVAQVVLNRMRHPAYPASVCGVVYQGSERPTGCQFSFTCDGSLARAPMRGYWERARRFAHEALRGYVQPTVGLATHYHANYVAPYWAPTLTKNAVLGAHIFYRWPGGWGQPASFTQKWAKRETDPWALRGAALAAEARFAETKPEASGVVEVMEQLPPELAALVTSEVQTNGNMRVRLTITPKEKAARDKAEIEKLDRILYQQKENASTSLQWGLTGGGKEAGEAPLGRAVAEKAAAPAPVTAP